MCMSNTMNKNPQYYHGLAKERPPPTFGQIFCIGSNFKRPLWSELHVEFEKHSLKRYAYLR